MAAYNAEKYVADSLQSLVAQSFSKKKYFILIIEDGSTDNTLKIVNGFKDVQNLVVVKNSANRGLAFSLNRALGMIRCKHVIRFDADDVARENLLSELHKNIGGYSFCHPYMFVFSGKNMNNKFLYKVSNLPTFFASGVLFKQKIISKYKFSRLFWEEFDLFLKILNSGNKYKILQKPLLFHRVHPHNMTASRKEFLEGYRALLRKWGIEVLRKYEFTLDNLVRSYGYYLES